MARAVTALLLLTGALVGIPALLLVVAPISAPTGLPSLGDITTTLTSPDHGQLLLAALTLAAWACWVVFALSTLVEIAAVARGLPTPRLPGLALPQGAAAALVASAAMLLTPTPLPTGGPPTTPAPRGAVATTIAAPRADPSPAPPAPAPAVDVPDQTGAGNAAPVPHTPPSRDQPTRGDHPTGGDHPTVTVQRGDTLWELAERHLGDGTRFREIAELNYHRSQPDGATLTDAHWIYPGWVLRLPRDAVGVTHQTRAHPRDTRHERQDVSRQPANHVAETADPDDTRREYVVRRGDTLWDIAQTHLGDPTRYRELFTLNTGRPQHDGQSLRDPALILPGWHLLLPGHQHQNHEQHRHKHAHPGASRPATREQPNTNPALEATTPSPREPVAPSPAVTVSARPPAAEPALPHQLLAPPTTHPQAEQSVGLSPAGADADQEAPTPARLLTLGLTGLAAAGIITDLARRRRHQQRRRAAGTRIAMPTTGSAAHDTERALRTDMDTPTLDLLQATLSRIASRHVALGASPPRIALIAVNPDQVELTLDTPEEATAAAMTPFTRSDDGTWTATRSQLLDTAATDSEPPDVGVIYPALVTLGVTDDAVVLANLEAAGTLTIIDIDTDTDTDANDDDGVLAVMRALGLEAATSPLTATCTLTVSPQLTDLCAVTDPSRLRTQDPDAMAAGLHARTTTPAPGHDLLTARTAGEPDSGAVHLYLSTTPDTLHADPWSGCVTVGAGKSGQPGWSLRLTSDHGVLEPHGLQLSPQRLTDDTYRGLLDLLHTTARADEPAQPDPEPQPNPSTAADASSGSRVAPADRRPATRINVDDDPCRMHPRIHVLGPVRIDTINGRTDNRKRRMTELITYLALHPDAPAAAIDDVLWNGRRVSRETRNSLVYRTRTWLGDDTDGTPYLLHAADTGRYRLHPSVTCDWHDFRHHVHLARSVDGEQKIPHLQAALDLVEDRPFLGVDPASYTWAEHDSQSMISAIVDTAHELATLHLHAGDTHAAQDAAAHGLFVDPVNELLYRDCLTAAQTRSDLKECQRLEQQLRARLNDLDPDVDLEPETMLLISTSSTAS